MKKIAILGSANALKPKIIIETLLDMNIFEDKEIVLFTEREEGICFELCREKGIRSVVFQNERLDDNESLELAKEQKIDLLVSCGWPYKIPNDFLGIYRIYAY
ncbi:hypothetical protein [Nosocomiicoccus massiliensis]|uniref:hypothetical protein n=1 Tax=Nosocomiicoccus massiliensis TaxID=1232430 RepID=UPI000594FB87|nr:hypothetical protein [Nosocomiicoccus massiliensis]